MWKRWMICLLHGHRWNKVPCEAHDDSGFFLRCRTCGHENHEGTSVRRPASFEVSQTVGAAGPPTGLATSFTIASTPLRR